MVEGRAQAKWKKRESGKKKFSRVVDSDKVGPGARAANIRLQMLKESQNNAVVPVYSDYFLDPFQS